MPQNPKNYTLRIKNRRYGSGGIIEDEYVREDPTIYPNFGSSAPSLAGAATTLPIDPSSVSPGVKGSTVAAFLDIASLTDSDAEKPGFYVAMGSYSANWTGAILYEKIGSEYSEKLGFGDRATIGYVSNILPSARTTIFDDTNTIDVELISDETTLESVADVDLFNGINAAVLGFEIILFGTATQTDERKYTLSHLIRGAKGTEWAVGTHIAGERFVLLDAAVQRIPDTLADLNRARIFHIASIGAAFEDGFDTTFTDTGVSLRPLAPVHVRAEQNAAGEVIIEWNRRSRQNGLNGLDFFDPPLAETTESYEVDILDTGETTVLRTLSATQEYVKYSVANQTSDYGSSPPAATHLNVVQISSVVGRGYPGHAIITTYPAGEKPDIGTFYGPTAPTSPVAGKTFWFDETNNTMKRWNGTAWESVAWGLSSGGGGGATPPGNVGPLWDFTTWDDGIYSWINQGTATISTTDGGVYLTTTNISGDQARLRKRTAPTPPYTYTMYAIPQGHLVASNNFGLFFRESSSGKFHVLNFTGNGMNFSSAKFNSPTSFSATYTPLNIGVFLGTGGAGVWMRIEDDGANRNCYLSPDGKHWGTAIHTITRLDFLTTGADEIGYYVNAASSVLGCSMWIMSLKVSP